LEDYPLEKQILKLPAIFKNQKTRVRFTNEVLDEESSQSSQVKYFFQ